MKSEPLTVIDSGTILFRVKEIELADKAYYSIELSN